MTSNQIFDTLDGISDDPNVHSIAENSKSSIHRIGIFVSIASFIEFFGVLASLFIDIKGTISGL